MTIISLILCLGMTLLLGVAVLSRVATAERARAVAVRAAGPLPPRAATGKRPERHG